MNDLKILVGKNNLMHWEEKLKDDLYFTVNLILKMHSFHENTNGITFRKGNITKTFRQCLSKQDIGKILLKEMEKRKAKQ